MRRFASIIFGFVAFLLLATFPGWHVESDTSEVSSGYIRPFPSRTISKVALGCLTVSAVTSLLSAFWQHIAGVAASSLTATFTYGEVRGGVGVGAMVCGWLSFFFFMVDALALLLMILSIKVLSFMVNEGS
jgi:hypothetical protein